MKLEIANFLQANPTKTSKDVTVACYGLAFKPDIDDLRESPAIKITRKISELHQGRVIAIEPNIMELDNESFDLRSIKQAEVEADISVLLVDHREFRGIDFSGDYLVDTKGVW